MIIRRKLPKQFLALLDVLLGKFCELVSIGLPQRAEQQIAQPPKILSQLWLLIRERVVQHPHPRLVAAAQTEVFHGLEISGLSILQLMKVFVHDGDQPARTGFTGCVCRFTNHDHRRRPKRRKCRQQVG